MDEQEIRAKALEIAMLNTQGRFFGIQKDGIKFSKQHINYLKAIERYIELGTYDEESDSDLP